MFKPLVTVVGITSLCEGKPRQFGDNKHLFMYDFDETPKELVFEEAERLSKKWGIDIYVLRSSSRDSPYNGYKESLHMVSFDILPWRMVQSIQADVRLENDYPLINERNFDKFLTLRISNKGKKKPPVFVKAFVGSSNYRRNKSLQHYLLYQEICKIPPAPEWYKWQNVELFFALYQTSHGVD